MNTVEGIISNFEPKIDRKATNLKSARIRLPRGQPVIAVPSLPFDPGHKHFIFSCFHIAGTISENKPPSAKTFIDLSYHQRFAFHTPISAGTSSLFETMAIIMMANIWQYRMMMLREPGGSHSK